MKSKRLRRQVEQAKSLGPLSSAEKEALRAEMLDAARKMDRFFACVMEISITEARSEGEYAQATHTKAGIHSMSSTKRMAEEMGLFDHDTEIGPYHDGDQTIGNRFPADREKAQRKSEGSDDSDSAGD